MQIERPWAFWRRAQYLGGFFVFFLTIIVGSYFIWFNTPSSCFDGSLNGAERGIDCGGECSRVCIFDVIPPEVLWSRSFKIAEGQYNAVAYVENKNIGIGAPKVSYTISLFDEKGLIIERKGTTVLPPDSVYPIFEGRIFTNNRVPIRTTLTLDETEPWLPSNQGRGQFIVENRELKDADNEPRLEASITNTLLVEAKDVEIVATIFDARGNALTASQTNVPIFAPQSTTDVVFTWPEPIAKTIRSCEIPTDVLLGIDLSGSMNDDGDNPPEPITSVLLAAQTFSERLREADRAGVVTFATESVVHTVLSGDTGSVGNAIKSLLIGSAEERGFTNTGDAFVRALEEFNTVRHNTDARKVFILMTDGLATAPEENPSEYAVEKALLLKEKDVEVFTIGLGQNVNEEFLQSIASEPRNYYQALSVADIDRIYRSITGAICEDGAAVIDIIPKTDANFVPLR